MGFVCERVCVCVLLEHYKVVVSKLTDNYGAKYHRSVVMAVVCLEYDDFDVNSSSLTSVSLELQADCSLQPME